MQILQSRRGWLELQRLPEPQRSEQMATAYNEALDTVIEQEVMYQDAVKKLEKNNPGGSMKDRMARSMVLAALEDGRLPPGGTIVESSSGNTGIGLALIALELGLRFIAVVDHHAAPDKIRMMRALGAEIRYVEGDFREDEVAVVERQRLAAQLGAQLPGALFMNQSDNPANPEGYAGFVEELLAQLPDGVDAYVGCVGTGGSMTGIAQRLKRVNDPQNQLEEHHGRQKR